MKQSIILDGVKHFEMKEEHGKNLAFKRGVLKLFLPCWGWSKQGQSNHRYMASYAITKTIWASPVEGEGWAFDSKLFKSFPIICYSLINGDEGILHTASDCQ